MRALLIEDDPAAAKSIETMLRRQAIYLDRTDSGEDGIDLCRHRFGARVQRRRRVEGGPMSQSLIRPSVFTDRIESFGCEFLAFEARKPIIGPKSVKATSRIEFQVDHF